MARPLTIGLTGGIAAGKSEALAAFERLGAATISSDAIVHDLLDREPLLGRLAERWGEEVAPEGRVDRSRVGEIVFADPEELAWLESQIHPLVGERIGSWLEGLPSETEVAVIEVPLLFETGMDGAFDATVSIVASEDVRRERAGARGHALVDEREARQLTQEDKAGRADHVVRNDGTLEELESALSSLITRLRAVQASPPDDPLQSQ
jgi:dephospho-CoA kinase